jgi:hypothetical protein
MITLKQKQMKEIFRMVYQWGQLNIKVDYHASAYQQSIFKLVGFKSNGWEKIGKSRIECFRPDCKRKHLLF